MEAPPNVGSPAASRLPLSPLTSRSGSRPGSQGKFGPIDVDALNSVVREAAEKDDYTALARLLKTLSLRTFSAPNQSARSFFSDKTQFCAELVPLIEKGVRAGHLDEITAKAAMESFKKSKIILPELKNVPGAEAVVVHGQQGAQINMNALALACHHEYYWRALLGSLPPPVKEGQAHLHEGDGEDSLSEKGLLELKNQVYTGLLGSCHQIPSRVLSELLFYAISTHDQELIENCYTAIREKANVMATKEEVLEYLRLLATLTDLKRTVHNKSTNTVTEYPLFFESDLKFLSELSIHKFGSQSVQSVEGLNDLAEFLELCHQSTDDYKSASLSKAAKNYILHPDTSLKESEAFLAVVAVIEKLPFLDAAAKDELLLTCVERWLKEQNIDVEKSKKTLVMALGSVDLLCESSPVQPYLVKYIKGLSIKNEEDLQVCLLWPVAQSNTSRSPCVYGIETIHAKVAINRELREQLQMMCPDLQLFILQCPDKSLGSFCYHCELLDSREKLPIPVIIQHTLTDSWAFQENHTLNAILKSQITFDFGSIATLELMPGLSREEAQGITQKLQKFFENYEILVEQFNFCRLTFYKQYDGAIKREKAEAKLDQLPLADVND